MAINPRPARSVGKGRLWTRAIMSPAVSSVCVDVSSLTNKKRGNWARMAIKIPSSA